MSNAVKPIGVKCFRCKSKFNIKYNPGKKEYSKKNDWSYWTKKDINGNGNAIETVEIDEKICDNCLKDLYLYHKKEFWNKVKSLKKRSVLRNYIYLGII
jgi:hypothetical protein